MFDVYFKVKDSKTFSIFRGEIPMAVKCFTTINHRDPVIHKVILYDTKITLPPKVFIETLKKFKRKTNTHVL